MITLALEIVRVLILAIISFFTSFLLVPILINFLTRFQFNKQIRSSEAAPIFSSLHQKKAGTPTMGGAIIWGTTLLLATAFFLLGLLFDGVFSQLNFIDRA